MNFNETLSSHNYSKNELIHSLFEWSYDNDRRLYCNLDDHFSAHHYRNQISEELSGNLIRLGNNQKTIDLVKTKDFSPEVVMNLALNKCDYHDSRRFMWTFTAGGSNRNDEYKYQSNEEHQYSFMINLIKEYESVLESKGLATFRKSLDYEKHKYLRDRLERFIEKGHYDNRITLLISYPGDSKVNQIFSLGIYDEVLKYILNNNIVSDPHTKSLYYRPFGFDGNGCNNLFEIKNLLGYSGGLIYVTTSELIEIYNNIPKHKIEKIDKAEWAYIKSLEKNHWENVRFYIHIED